MIRYCAYRRHALVNNAFSRYSLESTSETEDKSVGTNGYDTSDLRVYAGWAAECSCNTAFFGSQSQ